MEAEILKFICANSGAVNTEELINIGVFDAAAVTDIIRNREKFATVCLKGEPKVVARTRLRLCGDKDCKEGSCKALHVCKNIIFSESCNFRKGRCRFSHQLDSPHNQELLRTHGLESLDRAELRTLLLQNDCSLLPQMCFVYNMHGVCKGEDDCKMLHVCTKSLYGPCFCPRNHDFAAPQPLKRLQEKRVPDHLFPSLKTIYVNKGALVKFSGKGQTAEGAGGRGARRGRRGRGGGRRPPQQRAPSACSMSSDRTQDEGDSDDCDSDGTTASEVSSVAYDSDASSEAGLSRSEGPSAKPGLRLCMSRTCDGSCKALHLCKNFLLSGSCRYALLNKCKHSHAIDSEYNLEILKEHHVEQMGQAELCTLLLWTDDGLLPQICYDYNNGDGEHGMCERGDACNRLHICERFLLGPCSCSRLHDFDFPQPMRVLRNRGVPDQLVSSLKSIYAHKVSTRRAARAAQAAQATYAATHPGAARGRGGHRGNRGMGGDHRPQQQQQAKSMDDVLNFAVSTSPSAESGGPNPGDGPSAPSAAARGRGGNRGNRGNRGNQQQRAASPGGATAENADDSDASSASGASASGQNPSQAPGGGRGRGGSRGNGGRGGRGGSHQPRPPPRAPEGIPAADVAAVAAAVVAATAAATAANAAAAAATADDVAPERRPRPVRDKTEICMYFIKGHCKHEEKCFKLHEKMPYRWQVRRDNQWSALPDNEGIERDYCNPAKTLSGSSPPVNFDTMTCGTDQVRRLSTVNSVVEPSFIHTTEWAWYWEDENGLWNLYAMPAGGHKPANVDSAHLEEMFQKKEQEDVVEFIGGNKQMYKLSFSDMIQTNKTYGTKRLVRRRPKFVSEADVKSKKVRNLTGVPDHWDKTQIPKTGYKQVPLLQTSDEYKEIESLFRQTMGGVTILGISRIQNKELWESFQLKKNQMRNNNYGKDVDERKLFHGTQQQHVNDICRTNFDWRICGKNGTLYGKGSYFARDAKYSHNYTGNSGVRSMFVSRVLIGTYTKGSPDVVRPDVNRFNSCVDDIRNPSIFVVFDLPQVYPEYLLEYRAPGSTSPGYSSSSSGFQSGSSGYQSGSSGYQSGSSGYQSSSSGLHSGSSGYQSSSSGLQSGSSGYRSSSSGLQSSSSGTSTAYSYSTRPSAYPSSPPAHTPRPSVQRPRTPDFPFTPSPPPAPKKQSDSCVIA